MEELLQKIILKAYEVNENTKHDVFIRFSGHVKQIELSIFLNGWRDDYPDIKFETYFYNESLATEILKNMLKKLEELEKNIEGGE